LKSATSCGGLPLVWWRSHGTLSFNVEIW
jgi:hypothetical protein